MGRLHSLARDSQDRAAAQEERLEPGTVTGTVTAGQDLYVTLDSLPEQVTGPVKGWAVRTGGIAPGDRCLVARVAGGDYWFVTWDIPGWS